jgi:hypothetical protein
MGFDFRCVEAGLECDNLADGFLWVEELAGEDGIATCWIDVGMLGCVVVYEGLDVFLGMGKIRLNLSSDTKAVVVGGDANGPALCWT